MFKPVLSIVALSCLLSVQAFLPRTPLMSRPLVARPTISRRRGLQMGVPEAIEAYVQIWSPTIRNVAADAGPSALIKWFHGANMGIVLTTMATFGAYLGWKIRAGDGEAIFTGKTVRELHLTLMGLAFLFCFIGGQGGLVLLDVTNKPILQIPHAITAFIGIGLLAIQALLPKFFAGNENLRGVHAYLGSATMLLLFYMEYWA